MKLGLFLIITMVWLWTDCKFEKNLSAHRQKRDHEYENAYDDLEKLDEDIAKLMFERGAIFNASHGLDVFRQYFLSLRKQLNLVLFY